MGRLLTGQPSLVLWQDVVKNAEDRCSVTLETELENYLITLLMRYTDKPDLTKKIFATAFMEALQKHKAERSISLQQIGDQCLLFAGLFPHAAEQRHVKINYFVDLGRSAYANSSYAIHDLYWSLALQFVALMDVLQSIRDYPDLMPIEAYEQWRQTGSQRALKLLQEYTNSGVIPLKKLF